LHILKARMLEGRRAKARRGELGCRATIKVRQPDNQDETVVTLLAS